MFKRAQKKNDSELFLLMEQKIKANQYVFVKHAKQRLLERNISDLEVINILLNKKGCHRKRNKRKDILKEKNQD